MKTEIIKHDNTNKESPLDDSFYEFKIPHEDAYGNIYYTKETKLCADYDKSVVEELASIEVRKAELQDKVVELNIEVAVAEPAIEVKPK